MSWQLTNVALRMLVLPFVQVKIEEKSLMERYGQVYADYKGRVKRFFPYVY